jgi:hypothetical protein
MTTYTREEIEATAYRLDKEGSWKTARMLRQCLARIDELEEHNNRLWQQGLEVLMMRDKEPSEAEAEAIARALQVEMTLPHALKGLHAKPAIAVCWESGDWYDCHKLAHAALTAAAKVRRGE